MSKRFSGGAERRLRDMRETKWLWQKGKCWWCNLPMLKPFGDTGLYATMEHLTAVSDGGKNQWDNIRLAHAICNQSRHNPQPDPDSNTQRRIAAKRNHAATN